ncbi:SMP-30/gluconolactonase/LRE family protein [Algoriphagus hitonicola]|uniref:Sugar lactone lactonase YvrE n=1 Tax=Algoriphagus hitonicola TaxID=435880 RepID=A0A1I2UYD5_9BACT|nr:ATP-binding protein [Algoriphagus hitonicola]SFG79871.1 Sugar lactone lactonase YvrE [Algoriphagus hitonicola]
MKTQLKVGILGLSAVALFTYCSPQKTEETTEVEENQPAEEAKSPTLTMMWETPATLETVESVLYDEATGAIYTSNIIGQDPQEKDGKGSISIIDKDGNIISQDWVTGLNAPKGMGIANGKLYVTDITDLVEIEIATATVTNRWPVEGAEFLNDVATFEENVYFTDMNTGKVHLYTNGEISTVSEGHESINGIAVADDGTIYGLDASGLKKWNADGSATVINDQVTGGDGLVILGDGNFVASRWQGEIWFASEGDQTKMLDTTEEESNTADIGYNPADKVVYVPTFFKNKVVAYKLDY